MQSDNATEPYCNHAAHSAPLVQAPPPSKKTSQCRLPAAPSRW